MFHPSDKSMHRFNLLLHCAGGLVTLLGAAATYVALYAPAANAAERASKEIRSLQTALEDAPRVHREHARLSERLREVERNLNRVRKRVPQAADESEFLAAITRIADEVGLAITQLSPGSPQKASSYSQLDVTITGLAQYESICRFVERIRGLPRLAIVTELNVQSSPDGQGVYPFTLTATIFFDLLIQPEGGESRS